jgi:hypothetical protein
VTFDDLDAFPFDYPSEPTPNGAAGRKCHHPSWTHWVIAEGATVSGRIGPIDEHRCRDCGAVRDPAASRRGRANRSRGNRAELDVARSIPGARKMGPLGLPWDVEVGTYARLQVKKLASRPSLAEIARLIAAIPDTGDRLRGFVWVEAAGQGKRGQRLVWFLGDEFAQWHGVKGGYAAPMPRLVTMPLDEWVAEYVR